MTDKVPTHGACAQRAQFSRLTARRMATARRAIEAFSARPWASLLLAVLVLAIGALFVSGLLPKSQKYMAGHEWYMAALCFAGAAFFTYCAVLGIRQRRDNP